MRNTFLISLVALSLPASVFATSAPQASDHTPFLESTHETIGADPLAAVDLTRQETGSDETTPTTSGNSYEARSSFKTPSGVTTRELLRLQASGEAAAPLLPMLGQTSTAAYKRYLESFNHRIPEFFDTTVESAGGGK